jgi:hypothetical protein
MLQTLAGTCEKRPYVSAIYFYSVLFHFFPFGMGIKYCFSFILMISYVWPGEGILTAGRRRGRFESPLIILLAQRQGVRPCHLQALQEKVEPPTPPPPQTLVLLLLAQLLTFSVFS